MKASQNPTRPPDWDVAQRSTGEGLSLQQLREELNTYSDRISTQLRTVNLGVLGLAWLLLLKKDELATLASTISEEAVFGIALCCIVALLVDLSQYLLAEWVTDEAFDRAEKSETKTTTYDAESIAYRAQLWCYHLKKV